MARTVDDYDSMAKREIIKAKQEKAMMYVHMRTSYLPRSSVYSMVPIYSLLFLSSGASRSSERTTQNYERNSRS